MSGHRGTTPERHPWFLRGANPMTAEEAAALFDCRRSQPVVVDPRLDPLPNLDILDAVARLARGDNIG